MSELHQPVLLAEVIDGLAIQADGIYVDATLGRAGHTQAILAKLGQTGRLLAIDRDPQAIALAQTRFRDEQRLTIIHAPFGQLYSVIEEHGYLGLVNGILLDLGVSSPQLEQAERGFSFTYDGPLDMRMDPTTGVSAANWLARASEREIADVLYQLGDERYSRRIARYIVNSRAQTPITRTGQLAEIIKAAHPRWERHKHPATRSFQAIRIYINNELHELEQALAASISVLATGGRLAVISFHSLEDRITKRFIRAQQHMFPAQMRRVGKLIKPSQQEVNDNPRARSALLRIGEKIK